MCLTGNSVKQMLFILVAWSINPFNICYLVINTTSLYFLKVSEINFSKVGLIIYINLLSTISMTEAFCVESKALPSKDIAFQPVLTLFLILFFRSAFDIPWMKPGITFFNGIQNADWKAHKNPHNA